MKKDISDKATIFELDWDTKFFGVKSAKAILKESLSIDQWCELKEHFSEYQFISIENLNSVPENAQMIGKDTKAYLVDVNIQFSRKIEDNSSFDDTITITEGLQKDEQILKIADFQYSKFLEDPELAKRGGAQVYEQWLLNSFEKRNKYFACSRNKEGVVEGFLLHSYLENVCVIELIAVSNVTTSKGVGTRLFKSVEHAAFQKGAQVINVGTQVRNMNAINFYHKLGCKQVGCHQVFHLWYL